MLLSPGGYFRAAHARSISFQPVSHARRYLHRIDFHHHFFPPFTSDTLFSSASTRSIGWKFPEENVPWSPEISLASMDALGTEFAILSLTGSPSPGCEGIGQANRQFARKLNLYAADVCAKRPDRFGFFANIPIPSDTEAALEEIAFAFDELHADGINLTSSYSSNSNSTYIGDPIYDPIWSELDKRRALVFIHGAQLPSLNSWPYPSALLGLPVTSVPAETFKAAASLVLSGAMRLYPNCKIILSHLGGSTPFLAARVALLSSYMNTYTKSDQGSGTGRESLTLSRDNILNDFKRFYYECALSGYETNLAAVESFVDDNQILFGTDFPAVSTEMAQWNTNNVDQYYSTNSCKLDAIMRKNALKLLPRLGKNSS